MTTLAFAFVACAALLSFPTAFAQQCTPGPVAEDNAKWGQCYAKKGGEFNYQNEFGGFPVTVTGFGDGTVKFTVANTWKADSISHYQLFYTDGSGTTQCFKQNGFASGPPGVPFEGKCGSNNKVRVELFIKDGQISRDLNVIEKGDHPALCQQEASSQKGQVCGYVFEMECCDTSNPPPSNPPPSNPPPTNPPPTSTCPQVVIDAATRVDGSKLSPGQYIDPSLGSAGDSHFAVRKKADGDNLFDDGVIVQNGSSLQVGIKDTGGQTLGIEVLVAFNSPVTVHSLGIFDPVGDTSCTNLYPDTGMIHMYGRKGVLRSINLPSTVDGSQIVSLGDVKNVIKIVIDTGDGCWKTIDQVKVTPPCPSVRSHSRNDVVGGGAITALSPEMRKELADIARREGKKFEFPECVGLQVEECVKIVEGVCPECVGNAKPATPRRFDFYRIWIKCDENGRVVGVPRRG